LAFVRAIPPSRWCVDTRNNGRGQRCVLGHLDAAYGPGKGRDGLDEVSLAKVNNGIKATHETSWAGIGDVNRKPDAGLDGKSVKARVVAFLKSVIKRKDKSK